MTQPEAGVRLTSDAGVATLEIDCPPLNVLDIQTLEEVLGAIGSLSADETKVLVLRGREGAFSAGLDVREYAGSSFTDLIDRFHGIFRRLVSVDFPVVAVVDGYCLGAGLELVSVCDFTIASDDSVLGQPEIGLGLFPPVATIVLPRLIGIAPANELILTGRRVSAAEAWDMGLIWRSVAREDLEQEAQNLISSLTRNSGSVLRLAKRAMYGRFRMRFMEELAELESLYQNELIRLEDTAEGLAAFLEKRKPVWKDC